MVDVADPAAVVTVTFTGPAACAGVMTFKFVSELSVTAAATPPNVTDVGLSRPVPEIATVCPPATVPRLGPMPEMTGPPTVFVMDIELFVMSGS